MSFGEQIERLFCSLGKLLQAVVEEAVKRRRKEEMAAEWWKSREGEGNTTEGEVR